MSLRTHVALAAASLTALESIETSLAAGRSFEHQPSLVEHLVRIAVTGVALYDIKDLLAQADLTDEQLVRLQTQVQAVNVSDGLTSALVGERGVGYRSFHTFPHTGNRPARLPRGRWRGELDAPPVSGLSERDAGADRRLRRPAPKSLDEERLVSARIATQARASNPLTRMNAFAAAAGCAGRRRGIFRHRPQPRPSATCSSWQSPAKPPSSQARPRSGQRG
jgi:hypothetical protein